MDWRHSTSPLDSPLHYPLPFYLPRLALGFTNLRTFQLDQFFRAFILSTSFSSPYCYCNIRELKSCIVICVYSGCLGIGLESKRGCYFADSLFALGCKSRILSPVFFYGFNQNICTVNDLFYILTCKRQF